MNIWFVLVLISWCIIMFCTINLMKSLKDTTTMLEDLIRKNKIKDEYLHLIRMKAVGYDGYNTVKGLKDLIDELSVYAKLAMENDDLEPIWLDGNNHLKNILEEDLGEDKDEE